MRDILETTGVGKVYGEPIEHGEAVIIPAAEAMSVLAFGGVVYDADGEEGEEKGGATGGEGAGGFGRTFSRPVAIVIADREGVRIDPVRDVTKVVLAGITAAGFMAAMLMRMISPRRALKDLKGE